MSLFGILTLTWYRSFGLICPWFPTLVGSKFRFYKCSTNVWLTFFFNKWTFIDLMSNFMALCVTWGIWSWNSIYTMNSFTPIPWNSTNNASIMLINVGFTIPHSYKHRNTFLLLLVFLLVKLQFLI
jgi:hypothetical protein